MKKCEQEARGKCELPKDKDGKPIPLASNSKSLLESLQNPRESAEMSRQIAENNKKSFQNLERELAKCKKILPEICLHIDHNHRDEADRVERRREEARRQAEQYETYERRAAQAVSELSQPSAGIANYTGAFAGGTDIESGRSAAISGAPLDASGSSFQPAYNNPTYANTAAEPTSYETAGGYVAPNYIPPVRQAAPVQPTIVADRPPTQVAAYDPLVNNRGQRILPAVFAPTLKDKPLPAAKAPEEATADEGKSGTENSQLALEIEGSDEPEENTESEKEKKDTKEEFFEEEDDTSFFGSLGTKFFQSLGIGSPIDNTEEDPVNDPAAQTQTEPHPSDDPQVDPAVDSTQEIAQPAPQSATAQKVAALAPEVRKRAKEIGLEDPELVKIMGLHETVQPLPKDPLLESETLPAMNNAPVLASDLEQVPVSPEIRSKQPVNKTKYGALVPSLSDESDRYGN